ncbi:TIGR02281 family clan AA aspartic protease [Thioalkalicoccus limnaeus]|uniref:TIGR02281 family clan AA aspartic protease n=1 Tax=Thioalkalicoccus limnaeus TaxID=120681 RepID=A0ABV4BFR9_9GAMM
MKDSNTRADDLPSRIGKGMMLGAWVTGLAILWLFFQGVVDRQQNPNPDPSLELGAAGLPQVVLVRNRAGHYVANGTINGHPVTFLLDTGATTVAMPLDLARRLDLTLRPGGLSRTAGGYVATYSTLLDSVDLGGLEARQVRASVLPDMPGREVLLGMSYLKRFEMIQTGNTLTLRHPSG